jgi:hypothetical protein
MYTISVADIEYFIKNGIIPPWIPSNMRDYSTWKRLRIIPFKSVFKIEK